MPASSASRLSPVVKKRQLKPDDDRAFVLKPRQPGDSWSESLRSASGVAKVDDAASARRARRRSTSSGISTVAGDAVVADLGRP